MGGGTGTGTQRSVYDIVKFRILDFESGPSKWLFCLVVGDDYPVLAHSSCAGTRRTGGMTLDMLAQILAAQPDICNSRINPQPPLLTFRDGTLNENYKQQYGAFSDEELGELGTLVLRYAAQQAQP